jgi:hypothetical protein
MWVLEQARAEDAIVAHELAGYDLAYTVEYDDLFPELGAPPAEDELGAIAAWLGVEPRFAERPLTWRKQSATPLRDSIENYDEVAAALRGTIYENLLEDERMYRAGTPQAK